MKFGRMTQKFGRMTQKFPNINMYVHIDVWKFLCHSSKVARQFKLYVVRNELADLTLTKKNTL